MTIFHVIKYPINGEDYQFEDIPEEIWHSYIHNFFSNCTIAERKQEMTDNAILKKFLLDYQGPV